MLISRRATLSLRAVALLYLLLLLLLPVAVVFGKTFEHGFGVAWDWITTPAAISAFWLSLTMAAIAVPVEHDLRRSPARWCWSAGGAGRRPSWTR